MTDFNVVTEEELCPVLDQLLGRSWPIPFSEVPNIVAGLGWTMQGRRVIRSTLPVSLNIVSVLRLEDDVAGIQFHVSDTLPEKNVTSRQITMSAFADVKDVVSACLGCQPTRPRPWGPFGFSWELPDGRQINLLDLSNTIVLDIWSKRRADIEWNEIRLGIDPSSEPQME